MSSGVIAASGAGAGGSTSTKPIITVAFNSIKTTTMFGFERPAPGQGAVVTDDDDNRLGYGDLTGGTIVIGGINFQIFKLTNLTGNASLTNELNIQRQDGGTDFSMVSATSITSVSTSLGTLSMSSMNFNTYSTHVAWSGGPASQILGTTAGAEFELTIVTP